MIAAASNTRRANSREREIWPKQKRRAKTREESNTQELMTTHKRGEQRTRAEHTHTHTHIKRGDPTKERGTHTRTRVKMQKHTR